MYLAFMLVQTANCAFSFVEYYESTNRGKIKTQKNSSLLHSTCHTLDHCVPSAHICTCHLQWSMCLLCKHMWFFCVSLFLFPYHKNIIITTLIINTRYTPLGIQGLISYLTGTNSKWYQVFVIVQVSIVTQTD